MENILLLAASTFPKNLSESTYCYKDEQGQLFDDIKGYYQLEPVPKLMMRKYPQDNLKIVILCTKETMQISEHEEIHALIEEYPEEDETYINVKSPTGFFMHRICSEKSSTVKIIKKSEEAGCICCQNKEKTIEFVLVPLDEKQINIAIANVAKYIQDFFENFEIREFWIDTHGGSRDISAYTTAVVSLLKIKNIFPKHIFSVPYNHGEKKQKIVDQKDIYRVLDLVSGMDEFINYGSAELLSQYYANAKGKTKKIIQAMKEVSLGTQTCSPQIYEKGLDELGEAIHGYEGENPLFSVFIDYIKNDYGDLLDKNKRTVIAIVERCNRKHLCQQALTYIESRMPQEFFEKRVCYYEVNQENNNIIENSINQRKGQKYLVQDKRDYPVYIMNQLILKNFGEYNNKTEKWNSWSANYTKKPTYRSIITRVVDSNNNKQIPEAFDLNLEIDYTGKIFKMKSDLNLANQKKAAKLFRLHRALKDCRNNFNHGNNDGKLPLQKIEQAIGKYVQWTQELYQTLEKK